MFETIIASLLRGYVARYIDINADQLSVQLLYGTPIVVENLTFNKTALNNDIRTKLKLPIEIESLHVGKIQCSFVWSSLFFRSSSAALIIKIENVRALIKPIVLDDNDNQENETMQSKIEENDHQVKKQNRLDLYEQQLEKEYEYLGAIKSSSWNLKRLILSFLEKIQIQIIDVDISYESFTSDNNPYKIGLSFDNIQISNEMSNENMNEKLFHVQNLAFYVNSNSKSDEKSYILLPSNSIKIYFTQNYLRSSLLDRRQARYELKLRFDDLSLKSNDQQIRILSDVIRFIQYSNTHRKFITDPCRPKSKISKESTKLWWRYITLVIIRAQNYLKTPVSNEPTHTTTTHFWFNKTLLNKRLKQLTTYKRLYRLYLDDKYSKQRSTTVSLSSQERTLMNEIETEFDLDCLMKIRRITFRKRAEEQLNITNDQNQTANERPPSTWYMGYVKWISTKTVDIWKTSTTNNVNQIVLANPIMTTTTPLNENDERLQEQVNTFIAQSLEDEELSKNRRDALYLRLKFDLKSVQINLLSDSDTIFNFTLNNVSVVTEIRPKRQSLLFYVSLQDLNISDRIRTDAFSNIVYPKHRAQESLSSLQRAPVFELCYEQNPPSKEPKTKRLAFSLAVRSRGLCFVCCPMSLERLRDFFESAFIEPLSAPSSSSIFEHWTLLKDRAAKQLKSTFDQIFSTTLTNKMTTSNLKNIKQGQRRHKKNYDIYLDINAPQMIIPFLSNRALIIDFGYLTFINDEYRTSSCPVKNCDMHRQNLNSPVFIHEYFQQRPYFYNDQEQSTSPPPQAALDDDDEEYVTPDSSPSAFDGPLENETTNYPVNNISSEPFAPRVDNEHNVMYSSFSLSLCDMQLGYFTYLDNQPGGDLSSIIEKFGVCFLIQYRTVETFEPIWPLIKITATLPTIIFHLDPVCIETLCGTINNWGSFIEHLSSSIVSKSSDLTNNNIPLDDLNARLALAFHINDVRIKLNDINIQNKEDLRKLCEIRVENIDLTLFNRINSNNLSFTVQTLMIVDALRKHGADYELLLTSNRALDINTQTGTLYENEESLRKIKQEYLIRIDIELSNNIIKNENNLNVEIVVNKLHFLFNPETLSILMNFISNITHRMKTILPQYSKEENEIKTNIQKKNVTVIQINTRFEELSILLTNVLTIQSKRNQILGTKLEKVVAASIKHASLSISIESSTEVKAEISTIQIFNLLRDSSTITNNEQSSAIVDLGEDDNHFETYESDENNVSPSKAFYLSYRKSKINNDDNKKIENLSIEMASVCYTHSPKIIYKIEKIFNYMSQNSHSRITMQMEKMKQHMIRQGSILLSQYIPPNESVSQAEKTSSHLNVRVVLATPILIFRPQSKSISTTNRMVLRLGDIHVENSTKSPSNYDIKINDLNLFSIDLEHEFRYNHGTNLRRMYKKPHLRLPILDNISIDLHLKLTDASTAIDSELVSKVRMFLGKHQITLLQNIISSLTYNDNDEMNSTIGTSNEVERSSLAIQENIGLSIDANSLQTEFKKFSIRFQLPELILAFQADLDLKPTTVCEAVFGQFKMSIEQVHQFGKSIALDLNSLHIYDRLIKPDRCLFSTRCRRNSLSDSFRNDQSMSSSCPTENYQIHRNNPSSSVPAYAITDDSSTWTLIPSTTSSIRSNSSSPPAFIDITIKLIDKRHENFDGFNIKADAKFGEVIIQFIIPTWVMLFDIIGLIGGTPPPIITDIRENKEITSKSDNDSIEINIHVDAVSCLLQEDDIPPIRVSLQRFNCNIQTYVILEAKVKKLIVDGKLGSVSIYDLSPFGKLYEERFCTSGTNALTFMYTKEEYLTPKPSEHFPARLQLYLRMTSVQYIHTQRFLMDLIHFFERFQHNQECYNRIRSAAAGQTISCTAGRSTGIELNIEAGSPILILPEHALNGSAIILHLGNISINNCFLFEGDPNTLSSITKRSTNSKCLLDVISIEVQDTQLYSATYSKIIPNRKANVTFSNFAFYTTRDDLSSMLRERCYLKIQVERNLDNSLDHSSPTYSIKADLSLVEIHIDTDQYKLVRGILAYNIGEPLDPLPRPAMIVEDPRCVSTVLTGDVYLDMIFIIQMDNVGFKIYIPHESERYPLCYCAFIKSNFSFEKYSNNNQVLDLTCSSIKLNDTRTENTNQFRDILTSSSSSLSSKSNMQLEIHLLSTKTDDKFTIVLNHTRILFVVDWLIKFNDFLGSFKQIPIQTSSSTSTSVVQTKKSLEVILNFSQSELVLVQATDNPQSNALVLSGIMTLTYRENMKQSPLDCHLLNVTLFSCQMDDIKATAVSIIEPINITFNMHLIEGDVFYVFEVTLAQLLIRLSYSDVKIMLWMFQSIKNQIEQAQIRDVTLKSENIQTQLIQPVDNEFLLEYYPEDTQIDFRIRSTVAPRIDERKESINQANTDKQKQIFFNINSINFLCDQISLCLIDDCLNANIPLLNLNLTNFKLNLVEYETYRFHQADFVLNIDYYNRLLSGYEPFIEPWGTKLTLKTTNNVTSLFICSNHLLSINYTKTMHQLYDLVKNNWLEDYNNISKDNMYFRRPKPFEPYCFKNLVGMRVTFHTWMASLQRYDSHKHIVEHNETKSFTFPSESLTTKLNINKDAQTKSSSYSERRLMISIEGWQGLKPISIDRVGTFFRIASPLDDRLQNPVLVFIDVTMTQNSMRLITIRSTVEIRNKLLAPIDLRLKCGSGSLHDIRLETNEIRSLPLQFCSILRQIQVRPADVTFEYCGEPINWMEILDDRRRRGNVDDATDENASRIEANSLKRHRDVHSTDTLSFFRTCFISGIDEVYNISLLSKRTRLLAFNDNILSSCQLSVMSPLIVNNLLPCDLFFQIYPYPHKVRIRSYKSHREHALDINKPIDILFATDLYRMNKPFRVPSINNLYLAKYYHHRIPFYDNIDRVLLIDIYIVCSIRYRFKIYISVPYVLLNKSGIPLIFKQDGSVNEAAGQTHEHELARNREPLLFSFSDPEASHACTMKVGSGLHKNDDGRPSWSQRFSLERGSNFRQLYVRSPHGSSPDWIYYIGIDVRQGERRLRRTNFIFLSTRYMISNQCSYDLTIAQRHIIRAMLQTGDHTSIERNCLQVLKHSNVAFHWPRSDLDQLLCVRVINNRQYKHIHWSGGFLIDRVNAFHINLRYDNNQCLILRVQVIERGGTFFVVFMDSNQMPAPLRIKNISDVPIQFYQTETREELTYLRAFIHPQQSIDYAWDEPTLKQTITCSVVGGTKEIYDLQHLGEGENLCYENHICLALEQTFNEEKISTTSLRKSKSANERNLFNLLNQNQLVIDYIQGRLVLAQREENKRSQLWRMTSSGILVHTGSSSPRDWANKNEKSDDIRQAFVLDIEEMSGSHIINLTHTSGFIRLTIRRFDYKRALTQKWTFHNDGYLCMGETQMCVQVFGELKENSELVLGPRRFNDKGVPLPPISTMHIRPRRRLQGSGLLSVRTYADGPTRVLEIANVRTSNSFDNLKIETSPLATTTADKVSPIIYNLDLRLESGIGISIVSGIGRDAEELVFMIFNDIRIKYKDENSEQKVDATIGTIIISNQLLTTSTPCLLYATYIEDTSVQSAVRLRSSLQKPSANYKQLYIFQYLSIALNSITIQIDEILLWKLIDFFGIDFSSSSHNRTSKTDEQTYDFDGGEYDTQRLLSLLTSTQATRIYFNALSLSSIDLDLSVFCASSRSLPSHLLSIKRRAPFPLIRFENAPIHLYSYEQEHIFNTYDFFLLALTNFYINELKRQAFKILGSVDFLGNPLGLFNDVTDGFASLVDHGSVTGLVKNVAHGVADSTSKFTGTLSYGIGKLALDDEHDDMREAIANNYRGSSMGHVIGGTVGLAAGFIGGLTSLITQPYKGVVEDGIGGLFKGFAKGIVGTVSKPVVGVLDFANGLALAVKEGSRSSNSILRNRIRTTRCATNLFGLLQIFSQHDASGQILLYQMNKADLTEKYITRLVLSQSPTTSTSRSSADRYSDETRNERYSGCVHAMITTQRIIVYKTDNIYDESDYEIIGVYDFSAIYDAVISEDEFLRPYVQFIMLKPSTRSNKASAPNSNQNKKIVYRCDLHDRAIRLAREILRSKEIFDEDKQTYVPPDDDNDDDVDEDITDDQQTNAPVQMN